MTSKATVKIHMFDHNGQSFKIVDSDVPAALERARGIYNQKFKENGVRK